MTDLKRDPAEHGLAIIEAQREAAKAWIDAAVDAAKSNASDHHAALQQVAELSRIRHGETINFPLGTAAFVLTGEVEAADGDEVAAAYVRMSGGRGIDLLSLGSMIPPARVPMKKGRYRVFLVAMPAKEAP